MVIPNLTFAHYIAAYFDVKVFCCYMVWNMKWRFVAAVLFLAQPLMAKEPQLSCEKKFGQMTWEGMVFYRYRLRAENFPPKQIFWLVVKSFDGTQTQTFKYCSNHRGHLILQPPEDIEGEIIYAVCPLKRGERLTFLMQSEDEQQVYATDIVPFPLEMRSKKGVRLNLELQGEQGEKFLLFAQGFDPHEHVVVSIVVDGKEIGMDSKVTGLGDLCLPVCMPAGTSGTEAKLVVKRKSEEVVFPFQCGAVALKCVGACCFEIK